MLFHRWREAGLAAELPQQSAYLLRGWRLNVKYLLDVIIWKAKPRETGADRLSNMRDAGARHLCQHTKDHFVIRIGKFVCGEAFEHFCPRSMVEAWGTKRSEKPPLDFRGGEEALRLIHHQKWLLRRVPRETLQSGEGDGISGIGFEAGTVFANGVCDATLLLIQHRQTEISMVIDFVQG